MRLRMVSCGAAHTGVITDFGEVYVWGCGDGGRLGLGASRMGTVLSPVRVTAAAAHDHLPIKETDDGDPYRSVVGKHGDDGDGSGGGGGGGADGHKSSGAAAKAAKAAAATERQVRESLEARLMHSTGQGLERPFGNQRAVGLMV